MMSIKKVVSVVALVSLVVGCSDQQLFNGKYVKEAQVTDRTKASNILMSLPLPAEKIPVALYDFQDQTGQFRNNEKFTDYSSAVTKGGHAILTKALMDAGNKRWFSVIERNGLKDLLQERNVYEVMSNKYRAMDGGKLPDIGPMAYATVLLEGGIVSYDSNIITGGAGAIYLGIGGDVKYHRDMVTVYLRAVSVKTGEVLLSVTSSKTIFSANVDTNVLKYVTFDRLLQAEAGFSVNEPVQLGVRQAIETAVYSLVMEGAIDGLWNFADPAAGQRAIHDYLIRRDGTAQAMQEMMQPPAQPAEPAAQAAPIAPVAQAPAPQPQAQAPVNPAEQAAQQQAAVQAQQQQMQQQAEQQAAYEAQRQAAMQQAAQQQQAQQQAAQPAASGDRRYFKESPYLARRKAAAMDNGAQ